MWPFKSKEQKITYEQAKLLDSLQRENKLREEAEALAQQVRDEQKKALEQEQEKQKIARMAHRKAGMPHLINLQRYVALRDVTTDPVQLANINAVIEDRLHRARSHGLTVEADPDSIAEAIRGS